MIFLSWHHLQHTSKIRMRGPSWGENTHSATCLTCRVCTPFPFSLRPISKFVSSSNESQETPIISKYSPYVSSHEMVTLDPLQIIPVDWSFRSFLQYLIISPMKVGWRNGSPPEILIFTMPASASSFRPRFASSIGTVIDEVSVWKQNLHAELSQECGWAWRKKKKKDSHTVITSSMRKIINGHWDDLPWEAHGGRRHCLGDEISFK